MKRNVLLLTAVVLAAVMLSGCLLLPWTWGKVKVEFVAPKNEAGKVLLEAKNLDKYYKKDATIEAKFDFTADRVAEEFDFTIEPATESLTIEATETGYKTVGKVGDKNLKITAKLIVPKAPEADE